ncbi:TatD family hydrolase [Flavobacterium sp. J27]|uniref:TatD family hydrolase n=1 Tax=Flavobacterium sp. J27 TaxID=2060419 RepID=UPI001030B939|nr:TatD family hydrolase [Flavobacterium sp. J27]
MNNYIDIGINLTNKQFQNDKETVINKAIRAGVSKIILTGTSVKGSQEAFRIAEDFPNILYSTAGIHPHDAKSMDNQSIAKLRKLLENKEVVAVGECGLDFDRDFSPRIQQEQCYKAQLELACEIQKPLFLHERAAFIRFMAITNDFISQLPKAVVHCFTGSISEAKAYLDKGFYLGFTGAITDKKRFAHLKEVLHYVPMDRIMIETDAPFMLPKNISKTNLRKEHQRRNEPAFLPYVADYLALIKQIDVADLNEIIVKNTLDFFGL